MLNNEVVKQDITNNIANILTQRGISKDKYFDLLEKAESYADKKQNAKEILEIADRYANLLEINSKKEVKTTVTQEIDYSKMLKGEQPIRKIKQEITSNNIDVIDNYEVNGVIEENGTLETKEEEG